MIDRQKNTRMGTLYCVSTGPGDPELMTLKAVRIASECPVIALAIDASGRDKEAFLAGDEAALKENCVAWCIAAPVVPGIGEKETLWLSMPMGMEKKLVEESHEKAAEAVLECLKAGKSVAWLTLGDVTVYATSAYIGDRVKHAGFVVEYISGVPSFCAAAARLGRPLVSGAEQLHVIPSSYNIEETLKLSGTKVFMKAGRRMPQVKEFLEKNGCEVQGVQRCGMDGEKIYRNTAELDADAGYYTVLIAGEDRKVQNH